MIIKFRESSLVSDKVQEEVGKMCDNDRLKRRGKKKVLPYSDFGTFFLGPFILLGVKKISRHFKVQAILFPSAYQI